MSAVMKGTIGLMKDFSCWCSAHGIPQIGSARNQIIRLIWTLLYIGFVAIFGLQLYTMITKYYKHGVVVATEVCLLYFTLCGHCITCNYSKCMPHTATYIYSMPSHVTATYVL